MPGGASHNLYRPTASGACEPCQNLRRLATGGAPVGLKSPWRHPSTAGSRGGVILSRRGPGWTTIHRRPVSRRHHQLLPYLLITKATISIYQQPSEPGPTQSRPGFRLRHVAVVAAI